MPRIVWTPGHVLNTIWTDWVTSGDVRTVHVRRHGVGIYQAANRFWGSWRKAAEKAGVPRHLFTNKASLAVAAKARVRPGRPLALPCRSCGKFVKYDVAPGTCTIRCKRCGRSTSVVGTHEPDGWKIRTEPLR